MHVRALLIGATMTVWGCGTSSSPVPSPGQGGGGRFSFAEPPAFTVPTSYDCTGDDCPACARNALCAPQGTWLEGETCCAYGDAVVEVGRATAPEAVDVASDGHWAVVCGGFGATVFDVSDHDDIQNLGGASPRCQRASFGAEDAGGRVFYVSHHGDSWVEEPFLATFRVGGRVEGVETLTEPGVLYEGHAWADDRLYLAAHAGGLRIYDTSADDTPELLSVLLDGVTNAWTVAVDARDRDVVYVADFGAGLHVVDVADPMNPVRLETLTLPGPARTVSVDDDRIYVAMGGLGVAVLERVGRGALSPLATIETRGSAQSVAGDADHIAVAAWDHVAVYERETLRLAGTEKLAGYPYFEQDLGVSLSGADVLVAEWNRVHALRIRPGHIAPDLWVDEPLLQFPTDAQTVRSVVVRNRGDLPLEVARIEVTDPAYTASPTDLNVAPGAGDFFEVSVSPPVPDGRVLGFYTNDPDAFDATFRAGLVSTTTDRIDVGEPLTDAFGFLDPNGGMDLSGLDGQVVVLSYFALF